MKRFRKGLKIDHKGHRGSNPLLFAKKNKKKSDLSAT
nr:MAG TPA: hypothetical protein [Caudoviricetes sp.]